jgi:collagenase-like PrtC family protease
VEVMMAETTPDAAPGATAGRIGLTLGPCLFNWSVERLGDFYARIADEAEVDRVHVGEVVCGKRMPFSDPAWPAIIERLERAGKEVVLATLAMPSTPRERTAIADLAADDRLIELNDVTLLPARAGRPFVVGPFVNVYNEGAATFFAQQGATTICLPVELSRASVAAVAAGVPGVEIEVFAFGRLPLALSGRCYHARLAGLHKDSCQFVCDRDVDGLAVDTLEGAAFLAINGIQTLSHAVAALCPSPDEAAAAGIRRLRLSPHAVDMVAVADAYRRLADGAADAAETRAALRALGLPGALVDGYDRGLAGAVPALG